MVCRLQAAIDRLWIVLNDNEASIRTTSPEAGDDSEADGQADTTIEASVSPHQLADILRDLVYAEKNRQLFARVDVEDDLSVDGAQSVGAKHQLVARIETANPVAMPLLNTKPPKDSATGPLFPPKAEPKVRPKRELKRQAKLVERPLPNRLKIRFIIETDRIDAP